MGEFQEYDAVIGQYRGNARQYDPGSADAQCTPTILGELTEDAIRFIRMRLSE